MMRTIAWARPVCRFFCCTLPLACCLSAGEPPQPVVLPREGLVLPPVGRHGRLPLLSDALEAVLVSGNWKAPRPGDGVTMSDGTTRRWEKVQADEKGVLFMRTPPAGTQPLNSLEALHSIELQCQSQVAHDPESI